MLTHVCSHVSWKGHRGGLKSRGLYVMWDWLEFLARWGWWRRLQDPKGQVVSLLPLISPPLGCCYPFLEGRPGESRLGKLITQLIHPDQTGFLLGRCSADGMRKWLNLPVLVTDRGYREVGKLSVHPTRLPGVLTALFLALCE